MGGGGGGGGGNNDNNDILRRIRQKRSFETVRGKEYRTKLILLKKMSPLSYFSTTAMKAYLIDDTIKMCVGSLSWYGEYIQVIVTLKSYLTSKVESMPPNQFNNPEKVKKWNSLTKSHLVVKQHFVATLATEAL